jgi:hypothetical protein
MEFLQRLQIRGIQGQAFCQPAQIANEVWSQREGNLVQVADEDFQPDSLFAVVEKVPRFGNRVFDNLAVLRGAVRRIERSVRRIRKRVSLYPRRTAMRKPIYLPTM